MVAQQQVESVRAELVALEGEIGGLEGAQQSLHAESEAAHEKLSAGEVKLAETRQRAQFLADEVLREYQIDVATIDWKQQLWHADDEPEGIKPLDLDEEEEAERPESRAESL
jgi:chromosome segregation protein